jgi:hypothetical protein
MKTKCSSKCSRLAKKKSTVKTKFSCGVCLNSKTSSTQAKLPCGHSFCKKCISSWAKTENTCPFCRAPFESYEYRNKNVKVEPKRQRQHQRELFDLVVEATTRFLESTEYQDKVRQDLIERRSGIEMLVICLHRSIEILSMEENRQNFEADKLNDAIVASKNLIRLLRHRQIMV